jgi:hypothetical protein
MDRPRDRLVGKLADRLRALPLPEPVRRVARASIWAPGAIPKDELKYAHPLKRIFLPLLDVLIVIAGFYGVHSGIPSFDKLMPALASDILSLLFVAAGLVALFGISFPRLWAFEASAKYALVGMLGTYFVALTTVGGSSQTRDFIACLVLVTMPFMLFRLWILGDEWQARRERRRGDITQ